MWFLVLIYEFWFVSDKDRELSEAQAEIKALRYSERLREKAVEEVKIKSVFGVSISCSTSLFQMGKVCRHFRSSSFFDVISYNYQFLFHIWKMTVVSLK